ncbi:MAG: hypothetical protein R3F65_00290 [bacterium]
MRRTVLEFAGLTALCLAPVAASAQQAPPAAQPAAPALDAASPAPSNVELRMDAPSTAAPSTADRAALVDALRGLNRQLDFSRDRLAEALDVTGTGPVERLTRAQLAAYAGDHPRAAMLLLDLTARPGFAEHPAHPEAMSLLGESLWALGLRAAAVDALREALESPRQSMAAWRRRFATYLARAGERPSDEPIERMRAWWQRAVTLPAPDEPTPDEASLSYNYGRALFRAGAIDDARAVFDAIPVDDLDGLRARYFVGVIALTRGETLAAREAFEAAQNAWQALAAIELPEPPLPEVAPTGPAREARVIDEDAATRQAATEDATADDPRRALRRVGAVIHLALARMAAADGDDAAAWQLYREVPKGDPDHAQALAEATFVLFRQGEYAWCVRLIDQLLAGRGDDLSAAQLALWQAQLQARDADYEGARESYQRLEGAMKRRREALEGALQSDRRLFPSAALAWTAPEDARRARRLEAEIVWQQEALAEAENAAGALERLARAGDVLPTVRDGEALHARLSAQVAQIEPQVAALAPADAAELGASLTRLRGRLERFRGALARYDQAFRGRLARVVEVEMPEVARLRQALDAETAAAEGLAAELRDAARRNLDAFAAEALFGQVDLAWWRKEEISRRMREAAEKREAAVQALEVAPDEAAQREAAQGEGSAP